MEENTPPPMPPAGPALSIDEFLVNTAQRDRGHGVFELESPRMLELNLNGKMNTKMMRKVTGMMAGGLFNVRFEGSGLLAITSHFEPNYFARHAGSASGH